MFKRVVVFWLSLCSIATAQGSSDPLPQIITVPSAEITITNNLIISCGKGQVIISMKDGKVTLKDCTADEGAKAFWDAIEKQFPRSIGH